VQVDLGQSSLQGRRPRNEDYAGAALPDGPERLTKGVVLVVADGVGGHANGREAAEHSVRGLLSDYYATPDTWGVAKSLDTVLEATNRWLLAHARRAREYAGMATTLTAVVLRGTRYYVAHVGDSRAYLLRDGRLTQLTEDHTWEHPELSNVLRRAIGLDGHLKIDHADSELQTGDRFVLVTDGIWATLGDGGLAEIVARHADARAAADALGLEALRRGSSDNCTALVADVRGLPPPNLLDSLAAANRLHLPPRLKPGQRIDGLEVVELLHESRVTLLYKVIPADAPGAAPLVLKTLRPEAGDEEAVAALVHEEWLARRVLAPCFPQVASHPPRAHLYYLMSWHDGESLAARLARGHRFPAHEVVQLGIRLLRGVAELHRLGIVHRDIKPDNVHVDRAGQLRILDLGVAASDSETFREINNPGTPSYMAPELFEVRAAAAAPVAASAPTAHALRAEHEALAANASTDLYACGVTLYELLTRKYPYGEIEPFQTPRFGEPAPPTRYRPDTPRWLEALLLKACARLPHDRFETADEFLLALERGASRPLAAPRPLPLVQRNPSRALKAVALLSLVLNLVLLFVLARR